MSNDNNDENISIITFKTVLISLAEPSHHVKLFRQEVAWPLTAIIKM